MKIIDLLSQVFKTVENLQKVCALRVRYFLMCFKEAPTLQGVSFNISASTKAMLARLVELPHSSEVIGKLVAYDAVLFSSQWVQATSAERERERAQPGSRAQYKCVLLQLLLWVVGLSSIVESNL